MKPPPFRYMRPDTIAEALAAMTAHDDVRVLAGGQSLMAMLNLRLVRPAALLDISRLDALKTIEARGGWLRIGAMVTQADASAHAGIREAAPVLSLVLPHVGHPQTRSRGTIGGSVAHADPSAEIPLALAVAGGRVELRSRRSTRLVEAADFFKGLLTTARRSDELLCATHWPVRRRGEGFAFEEFAMRHGDFALVSAVAKVVVGPDARIEQALIGLGGVADRPVVVDVTSEQRGASTAAVEAKVAGAFTAEDDLHASAAYRADLARTLARAALAQAASRARRSHADS